jgi:DNA-directed RNA polymerase subunit RPC12/RpoP
VGASTYHYYCINCNIQVDLSPEEFAKEEDFICVHCGELVSALWEETYNV